MPKMRGVAIDAFCPSTSLTQKQLYNLVLIIGKVNALHRLLYGKSNHGANKIL